MNLKKYIRLKENPREVQLTEEEEVLYNSLVKRVETNSAERAMKKRVSLWKILTPVVSFVCAIAIVLTCVFTLRTPEDFIYSDELIKSEKTTFAEMQEDVTYFDITFIENSVEEVIKFYDSQSNDKLYYTAFADIDFSTLDIVVVINDRYNYEFEINDEILSKELADYTVTYNSLSSRGDPQINYKGWIKVQTETVYFEYVQIPALGDEAFFESIQQIIKLKQ